MNQINPAVPLDDHNVLAVKAVCWCATVTAAAIIGYIAGYHNGEAADAERIAAYEEICRTDGGLASYPVTKNGDLRGCLRVPEGPNYTAQKSFFVRKER